VANWCWPELKTGHPFSWTHPFLWHYSTVSNKCLPRVWHHTHWLLSSFNNRVWHHTHWLLSSFNNTDPTGFPGENI